MTRQVVKARYHDGVLEPLEPLALNNNEEVRVIIESEGAVSAKELLDRAARVYEGLTTDQIAHVESIALDRRHFSREPAA
jgi:predicted DNA-binding antitoxin AbrB/MazE fold protein